MTTNTTLNEKVSKKITTATTNLADTTIHYDENHNNIEDSVVESNESAKTKQKLNKKNVEKLLSSTKLMDNKHRSSRSRSRSSSVVSNRSSGSESNYYLRSKCPDDCCAAEQELSTIIEESLQQQQLKHKHQHSHHHHHHHHQNTKGRKRKSDNSDEIDQEHSTSTTSRITKPSISGINEIKKSKLVEVNEEKRIEQQYRSEKANLIFTTKSGKSLLLDSNNKVILIKGKESGNKQNINNQNIQTASKKKHHSTSTVFNSSTATSPAIVAEAIATEQAASPIVVSSLPSSTKNNNNNSNSNTKNNNNNLSSFIIKKDHNQNKHIQQTKNSDSITAQKKHSSGKKETVVKIVELTAKQQSPTRQRRSSDEEIRYRYQRYLEWETKLKDQNKTDYTYAHSYSYSPLVSPAEQFDWTVPNMSRPSIRHRGTDQALDEKHFIPAQYMQSVPIVTRSQSAYRSDTHFIRRKDIEPVYHSTPVKSINHKATSEFSDDDDELNSTILTSPRIQKTVSQKYTTNYASRRDHDHNFSEEDDEEELTTIRKITRYIITTIRNTFTSNVEETEYGNLQTNGTDVPLSSTNYRQNYHLYSKNQNTQQTLKNSANPVGNNAITPFSSWFWFGSATDVDGNEDRNNGVDKKRSFWCGWPFWLLLLFFLFLLPLLLSYLLGWSYSSSYYKLIHLHDESKFIDLPSSVSPSYLTPLVSSIFVWPQFLSSETWRSFLPYGKLSSSSHLPNQDLSELAAEIFSLKQELLALKNNLNSGGSQEPSSPPSSEIDGLLAKISELQSQLTSCCRANLPDEIENRVHLAVSSKMSDLQQHYDARLKSEVENVKSYLLRFVNEHYADLNNSIISRMQSEQNRQQQQTETTSTGVDVQNLIRKALAKYDADKTGKTDFALESSGAWIISTRCSESYELYSASYKLLGLTLWRSTNSPRVVIQYGVVPGECWCFKGSEGRIAIHLSARIIPTAFSYEHIPVELSRDGHIRSAPHRFLVYGLRSDNDEKPELLGEYEYKISDGDNQQQQPLQRFTVQNVDVAKHTFDRIELSIKSNHGHPEYTCLYRFRVHGILPATNT